METQSAAVRDHSNRTQIAKKQESQSTINSPQLALMSMHAWHCMPFLIIID